MPNPDNQQPSVNPPPSDPTDEPALDVKDWVMRHLHLNDPLEHRRNELRHQAETAGFEEVDVCNLGTPDFWEVRFSPGANVGCTTAAEAERWLIHIIGVAPASVRNGKKTRAAGISRVSRGPDA